MLFIKTVSLEFVLSLFVVVQCKGPPAIIGTLKPEYTVREGQTVKLRCKVSGTKDSPENRTLTGWQKLPEGHYITDKFSRFKMRIGRYLKIKKVVLADQGTYVCIAHNAFGRLSREIKLVVEASNSSIRKTKMNPSIAPMSSTARSFTANEPPVTRTTKLPTQKEGYPPKFRNPSNRSSEYAQGMPITLKCHAHGDPPLNFTWLKNGKRLGKADRLRVKSRGRVLNFRELSYADTGTYTCTVSNAFGSIVKTFAIKVAGRRIRREHKPSILEIKNETARTGDDATFICSAISRSHPKFHYLKWRNVSNGSNPFDFIDFNNTRFGEFRETAKPHVGNRHVYTHRLIIRNVTLTDEAKYTCVVGNSAGWVSKHAFLTVLDEGYVTDENDRSTEKQFTVTKAPRKPTAQSDKEILVEEVPLAALIGVPVAVVILLIGTIVWCYFMTRKHHSRQHWKDDGKQYPPQQEKNGASPPPQSYAPTKSQTRNVSFNVYVDCPNEWGQPPAEFSRTQEKRTPKLEHGPPLGGLKIYKEPQRTHTNRTNHRKRHEREEFEFSESSGSEMKCSGV